MKTTTNVERHQDSHSKCCEVNHENSIYLLKFTTENACELFVMAVIKAVEKEKESKFPEAYIMYISKYFICALIEKLKWALFSWLKHVGYTVFGPA